MALYCAVTNRDRVGNYWYLYTLCFSNATHGEEWEEWYVGQTEYNFKENDGTIIKVKKPIINNISTYNNEMVTLPSDCTGMFSNMTALGVDPGSYYNAELSFQHVKDVYKDFSNFDTSQVTCMKSMFENSFGFIYVEEDDLAYKIYNTYLYTCKSLKLIGLDSWDVSNVTDMSRMFAHINIFTVNGLRDSIFSNIVWDVSPSEGISKNFTAKEMFLGSCFSFSNFKLILGGSIVANLEGMFNGFGSGYFTTYSWTATSIQYSNNFIPAPIDLTGWSFSNYPDAEFYFNNMFRNTLCSKLMLPTIHNYNIKDANYMFAYTTTTTDLTKMQKINYPYDEVMNVDANRYILGYSNIKSTYYTSSTKLKSIQTTKYSDWSGGPSSGYSMFSGQTLLNNFNGSDLGISRANTQEGYGYFENLPPLPNLKNYIKLNSGWKDSTVYIKTSSGWKESGVYM